MKTNVTTLNAVNTGILGAADVNYCASSDKVKIRVTCSGDVMTVFADCAEQMTFSLFSLTAAMKYADDCRIFVNGFQSWTDSIEYPKNTKQYAPAPLMRKFAYGKLAKKMLAKYWGIYIGMGDTFLENLQGLTTLKIYQADEQRNEVMNEKAELFRKITMKVLFMQLSSIIVMDFVAYGGAGAGIIMTLFELQKGRIGFRGAFAMMMLSAEFFLPMRALGSLFHVAMNGISASTKIFHLLDLPEEGEKVEELEKSDLSIKFEDVKFGYEAEREILHGISLEIPSGKFVSIVGESGCGKSTISQLISGVNKTKVGKILIGGKPINDVNEVSLMSCVTTVTHNSYIFKGTVRSNLLMAKQNAKDEEMWESLGEVNLRDYFKSQNGLDTEIAEKGANLSGGQCQRLAMARALLADSPVYIFDEATSNIDVESEEAIMALVHKLAKQKTVILISHRLANVVDSDIIYVLEDGHIVESGKHVALMANKGQYERLYTQQYNLEHHVHQS